MVLNCGCGRDYNYAADFDMATRCKCNYGYDVAKTSKTFILLLQLFANPNLKI
jgi:hypothetical protein